MDRSPLRSQQCRLVKKSPPRLSPSHYLTQRLSGSHISMRVLPFQITYTNFAFSFPMDILPKSFGICFAIMWYFPCSCKLLLELSWFTLNLVTNSLISLNNDVIFLFGSSNSKAYVYYELIFSGEHLTGDFFLCMVNVEYMLKCVYS